MNWNSIHCRVFYTKNFKTFSPLPKCFINLLQHSLYRVGRNNLYTRCFMNFAKYFYWERLLPVAVWILGSWLGSLSIKHGWNKSRRGQKVGNCCSTLSVFSPNCKYYRALHCSSEVYHFLGECSLISPCYLQHENKFK